MKIDAHHHYWKYNREEYGWIDDAMSVIQRDFLPADLARELGAVGIEGVISVQARQSLVESRWLQELAARNEFMRGVVGWVPLVEPGVGDILEELRAGTGGGKLRGVRHVLQGEPDDRYMLRADFQAGLRHLTRLGLAYDVLVFERHLPVAAELADAHPEQVFVLDHLGKPRIKEGEIDNWAAGIRKLARQENVFCKVSGLVTEADWQAWTSESLRRYFDVALEAFGPERLMFGSDWPVCLVASGYEGWWRTVEDWAAALGAGERAALFGGTAIRAYGL